MHIAINAHLLAHTRSFRRAGVSHYVEQLLYHLAQVDQSNTYTIYTTRGIDADALKLPPRFRVRSSHFPTINPRVRIPWEQVVAPFLVAMQQASLFHGVLNVAPLACPVPTVITIHDLAFIRFPETFRSYNRTYLDFATRLSAKRASRILAVSEHTRQEVIGLLGVPADRVIVTHDAARDHFVPPAPSQLEEFRMRKGLPAKFILYVGTLEPRKNLVTLLEAYHKVRQVEDVPLIIGGGKGWLYKPFFKRLEELQLKEHIHFAGYIEEEELPLWYAAARAFVFPSIYEGFGMPPLEAMSCGTPVITSQASSLPEVVGDAGLTVHPTDVDGLAQAIVDVVRDDDLHATLRKKGLQQAQRFSWRTMAEQTLQAYNDVARGV